MHQTTRRLGLLAAACAALAVPSAATAATVTVRVEGETSTLIPETTVTIGSGSGVAEYYGTSTPLPISCTDDSAAEALEQATGLNSGTWDRSPFIETIMGETLTWPESWSLYDTTSSGDPHYADWGACDLRLSGGERLVFQAGHNMSVANWRPFSPILEEPFYPSGSGTTGSAFNVSLTKWVVPNTPDEEDPEHEYHWLSPAMVSSDAAGYRITASRVGGGGSFTGTTNSSGVASITVTTGGNYRFKADATTTGITGNWARSPQTSGTFCVAGGGHTC